MDRETRRAVEEYRHSEAGPIENNLIDELVAGELDREEFVRRATVFGLGAGTIGLLLRYMGDEPAFAPRWSPRRSAAPCASGRSRTTRVSSRTGCGRLARSASQASRASI
jgi:hypothetical protein